MCRGGGEDIAGLGRGRLHSQQLRAARAHLCAEIIRLRVGVGLTLTYHSQPFFFLKKEKERQLASWRPEAVSHVLPGKIRGIQVRMGRCSERVVVVVVVMGAWFQQTDSRELFCTKIPRCSAAENPCPLSPVVQIIFSRHNSVFRAQYISQTQ